MAFANKWENPTGTRAYYAWRNTKWELTEYLMEVCQGPGRQYFRPNFWPNTRTFSPKRCNLVASPCSKRGS